MAMSCLTWQSVLSRQMSFAVQEHSLPCHVRMLKVFAQHVVSCAALLLCHSCRLLNYKIVVSL
jgi:hypothetical protein